MTNVDSTSDTVVLTYVGLGSWIGLATGNPGNTNAPAMAIGWRAGAGAAAPGSGDAVGFRF